MKRLFFHFFFLVSLALYGLVVLSQSGPVLIIDYPAMADHFSAIPKEVEETSGLIHYMDDIWTHNDSGGLPEIYRISPKTGKITQRVTIANGKNIDWEDISQDESYIYIGDFGNNRGNRRDLKIYKIKKAEITDAKKVTVNADVIGFSYFDQTSFDADNRDHNFDCESLISYGDSLIIFTRNRNDGRTRMYKLPKTPGKYEISPIADFNTDGLVTGADYSDHTGNLVLIGYKERVPFIWLFKGFTGNSLESPAIYRFNFPRMKGYQTEGIAWLDTQRVAISSESRKEIEQAAFVVDLKKIIDLAPPARN
ncbi:MAG: hypothetical protein ACNA7V_10015 [Bacteroidales bacterium]